MPSKSAQKKTEQTAAAVETKTKSTKTTKSTTEPKTEAKTEAKTKTTSKTETKTPQPSTQTTSPEVANVVVTTDAPEFSIGSGFSEFISKFQSMLSQFNTLKAELRNLEKVTVKQLKVAQKLSNKKRRKGTRAPSGFVRPAPISDELATFLGKPSGTEMARTDVTREINQYIRAHNLQDKDNGRKINPDKQLAQLLKLDDTIDLTYFNLQKYMGPHFPKVTKPETTTTTTTA
jgi:upstream activation factor subunit UAF30